MVKAKYTVDGNKHTLFLTGHAGYDEYGKDIVCAGISAIVQALICWAENNPGNIDCVSIDDKAGEVIVACKGGDDVSAVFYMTALGLVQVADSYPDHIDIDIIGLAD